MEITQIRKEIEALQDGESFIWPESDYGRAEIWKKNEMFIVFSIPMYGGYPCFEAALKRPWEVVEMVAGWE
jgi:hypothetical protein